MRLNLVIIFEVMILSACSVPTTFITVPSTGFPASPPTIISNQVPQRLQGGQIAVLCTNTPSDASTINSAIASSAVGDEILISGQCLINQTIKLLGDRSYSGTSRTGTVLKQADGANLVALLASDSFLDNLGWTGAPVSVRHLKLDGNSANNTGAQTAGILLRSWMSVVEDVYITDMSGDGLRLTNKSANGTGLKATEVNGRISGNFIDKSGRYGVYVEDSQNSVTDWTLSDNWIGESVDGIHLEDAAGWMIERNNVYRAHQNAIYADRLFGTSISDNYIGGFGETKQAGIWYGISATIQGGAASTISGNRIFNHGLNQQGNNNLTATYRYLGLTTVNYGVGMVSVNGNTIRGTNSPNEIGLYYASGGSHSLTVISLGNAVEDVSTQRLIDGNVTLSSGY
jgi:copper-binding protein NosD